MGGGMANRPGIAGGNQKAITSISQTQQTAHIYQSGDKTGMYSGSQQAGVGSVVSIGQMNKKPGGGIAGRPGVAGGSKPIMPLLK